MTPTELKQWREDMGWTQQIAAEHLDVALRTYKGYEWGTRSSGGTELAVPRSIAIAALALRFARDVHRAGGSNG
jgi:DNA-binding XRE family transcriptional regulator